VILANFALPYEPTEEDDKPLYDEVMYTDLGKEEATKVVETYNKVRLLIIFLHRSISSKVSNSFRRLAKKVLESKDLKDPREKGCAACLPSVGCKIQEEICEGNRSGDFSKEETLFILSFFI